MICQQVDRAHQIVPEVLQQAGVDLLRKKYIPREGTRGGEWSGDTIGCVEGVLRPCRSRVFFLRIVAPFFSPWEFCCHSSLVPVITSIPPNENYVLFIYVFIYFFDQKQSTEHRSYTVHPVTRRDSTRADLAVHYTESINFIGRPNGKNLQ